ncbi:MAG: TFIIB-type zinc ribbon-containing protein [Candidatus Nanoarchaeia archaeon]
MGKGVKKSRKNILENKKLERIGKKIVKEDPSICPSCKLKTLYTNPSTGETYCRKCGLVIE